MFHREFLRVISGEDILVDTLGDARLVLFEPATMAEETKYQLAPALASSTHRVRFPMYTRDSVDGPSRLRRSCVLPSQRRSSLLF